MVGTLRIFVAGATGVLGRRLVAELADRGHVVVGLTRDREGDELVAERGGVPRRGDVLDADSLQWAIGDADVVVHAASAVPTGRKPDEDDWERNDRVRGAGARNLTVEAGRVGASRYVQASVAWVARRPDGGEIDEFTPPNPERTTRSALRAERRTRAAERFGLSPVVLRNGWFYAHDSAQTRQLARGVLAGRMPAVGGGLLGRGDPRLSLVHPDDAARAFADACETTETGTYHVVDDDPVSFARFLRALADRLGASRPRRIPGWLARPFVGRDLVRFLTTGFPTSNDPLREALDWTPEQSSYREGLDLVVERWLDEGVLREAGDGYEWAGE